MRRSQYGFSTAGFVLAASLGVTTLAAAPHVDAFMADTRLLQQADGFLATLKFAQSEAIRREVPVAVGATPRGWQLWEDGDRNGRLDPEEALIRTRAGSQSVTVQSTDGRAITFLPSGFIDLASTESRTFVVCNREQRGEGRSIRIAATGTLRITPAACGE